VGIVVKRDLGQGGQEPKRSSGTVTRELRPGDVQAHARRCDVVASNKSTAFCGVLVVADPVAFRAPVRRRVARSDPSPMPIKKAGTNDIGSGT